jgi:hypothetical protein
MQRIIWFFLFFIVSANVFAATKQLPPVRALYLSPGVLLDSNKVQHFIELTKHTRVNAYVIDAKGEDGKVHYKSQLPAVLTANAWSDEYELDRLLKQLHKNHIRVIARIVCFNDPLLSAFKPALAVTHADGTLYKSPISGNWLNPVNKENWKYLVDIAKECTAKGFDEIQFDYVRFPTDGDVKDLDFGQPVPVRHFIIDSFLAYARKQMPRAILSADVFGIICESVNDPEKIGQTIETVGKDLDYISPMIYPSLFACGQEVNRVKFEKPDLDPYNVVYNTITGAKKRIATVNGYRAKIRPYLQAYTASWLKKEIYQTYGPEQIRQQIKAANDAGCDQWIFWNEDGIYPEEGLKIPK